MACRELPPRSENEPLAPAAGPRCSRQIRVTTAAVRSCPAVPPAPIPRAVAFVAAARAFPMQVSDSGLRSADRLATGLPSSVSRAARLGPLAVVGGGEVVHREDQRRDVGGGGFRSQRRPDPLLEVGVEHGAVPEDDEQDQA